MPDINANTFVIIGASNGIGKAAARLFLAKGWNVVATVRNSASEKDLTEEARVKLVALNVQDPEGPKATISQAIKAFGGIDVWLNNAGHGAFGPVEAGTRADSAAALWTPGILPPCRTMPRSWTSEGHARPVQKELERRNSPPRSSTRRRPTRATICVIPPAPTPAASSRCAAWSAPAR